MKIIQILIKSKKIKSFELKQYLFLVNRRGIRFDEPEKWCEQYYTGWVINVHYEMLFENNCLKLRSI